MNYNLTLKRHAEYLTQGQGHDLTRKGHAAYHRRPEHIYGIFIALACLYQKLLPKNCV